MTRTKDEDRRWRNKRNRIIVRRFREGDSARALGHDYGLHPSSIWRILRAWRKAAGR
jgi:transposase